MRMILALPLAAAFALSACGSSDEPAEDGAASGDEVSLEDAAKASKKIDAPRKGQYKTRFEIIDFAIPGMPAAMMTQMSGSFSGQMESTYCQTDDGEDAARRMTDNVGRGDCTYNSFDASANRISADMICTGERGAKGHYKLDGMMSGEGSDLIMEMDQEMPENSGGALHMKARVVSERIGDC